MRRLRETVQSAFPKPRCRWSTWGEGLEAAPWETHQDLTDDEYLDILQSPPKRSDSGKEDGEQ